VYFWRVGSLAVAVEEHQVPWLRDEADGERAVFLDADALRQRVNSPTYLAGNFSARDTAMVHPAKLTRELLRACLEAGVEVFSHSPVKALNARPANITLHLSAGEVLAERVSLATNAYPSVLKRFRLHTVPVYDYVLMTEPLTSEQKPVWGGSGVRELLTSRTNSTTTESQLMIGFSLVATMRFITMAGECMNAMRNALRAIVELHRTFSPPFPNWRALASVIVGPAL